MKEFDAWVTYGSDCNEMNLVKLFWFIKIVKEEFMVCLDTGAWHQVYLHEGDVRSYADSWLYENHDFDISDIDDPIARYFDIHAFIEDRTFGGGQFWTEFECEGKTYTIDSEGMQ